MVLAVKDQAVSRAATQMPRGSAWASGNQFVNTLRSKQLDSLISKPSCNRFNAVNAQVFRWLQNLGCRTPTTHGVPHNPRHDLG
jgi:hypothetical protein